MNAPFSYVPYDDTIIVFLSFSCGVNDWDGYFTLPEQG
jgi:hypothetical protein